MGPSVLCIAMWPRDGWRRRAVGECGICVLYIVYLILGFGSSGLCPRMHAGGMSIWVLVEIATVLSFSGRDDLHGGGGGFLRRSPCLLGFGHSGLRSVVCARRLGRFLGLHEDSQYISVRWRHPRHGQAVGRAGHCETTEMAPGGDVPV